MFSLKLKSLREEAGYSQARLAAKLGVSQSTVGGWESGTREPSFKTLMGIADLFVVSVDYLLGRTDLRLFGEEVVIGEKRFRSFEVIQNALSEESFGIPELNSAQGERPDKDEPTPITPFGNAGSGADLTEAIRQIVREELAKLLGLSVER